MMYKFFFNLVFLLGIFSLLYCQNNSSKKNNNITQAIPRLMDTLIQLTIQSNDNISSDNLDKLPLWAKYQKKRGKKEVSAFRIYQDGEIYFWQQIHQNEGASVWAWNLLSKIRPGGIEQIKTLIKNEFFQLPTGEKLEAKGRRQIIWWMANLDNQSHVVKTYAMSYSQLPEVLNKIQVVYNKNIIPKHKLHEDNE